MSRGRARDFLLGDERLSRRERLRLRSDFARVFARKRRAADDLMVVYVAPNGLPWSRLGLSVGRRIGGAVQRNYVRRGLREAFRTSKGRLPGGLDIVCVALPKAKERRCDLVSSLCALTLKAAGELLNDNRA